MYNNYEDWEEANCQADKNPKIEELEQKLYNSRQAVKKLLKIFYSKDLINENDLNQMIGYLADSVDLCLPEGTIQIARKSQALMDLQRYLLVLNER